MRAIVFKDRDDRRAGFSVDTAGAIARVLERAYAQGFADAQAPAGTVQKLGDGDGNGMTSLAEAGWESVDGVGAAAG